MGSKYLKEIPMLPNTSPISNRVGMVITYQEPLTGIIKDYRLPDSRIAEMVSGNIHAFYEIPAHAFADAENPTTGEVKLWALNPVNVPNRDITIIGYSRPSDSTGVDFSYVWVTIDKNDPMNPLEVIRIESPIIVSDISTTESINTTLIVSSVTLTAATLKQHNMISDAGGVDIVVTLPNPLTLGLLPGTTKSFTFKRANNFDGGSITLVGDIDNNSNYVFVETNHTSVTMFIYDNKYKMK